MASCIHWLSFCSLPMSSVSWTLVPLLALVWDFTVNQPKAFGIAFMHSRVPVAPNGLPCLFWGRVLLKETTPKKRKRYPHILTSQIWTTGGPRSAPSGGFSWVVCQRLRPSGDPRHGSEGHRHRRRGGEGWAGGIAAAWRSDEDV